MYFRSLYYAVELPPQGSSHRGGYQSGRARPAGRGMYKPRGGRGGRGRGGGIPGSSMALRRATAPPTAGWHKVTEHNHSEKSMRPNFCQP